MYTFFFPELLQKAGGFKTFFTLLCVIQIQKCHDGFKMDGQE